MHWSQNMLSDEWTIFSYSLKNIFSHDITPWKELKYIILIRIYKVMSRANQSCEEEIQWSLNPFMKTGYFHFKDSILASHLYGALSRTLWNSFSTKPKMGTFSSLSCAFQLPLMDGLCLLECFLLEGSNFFFLPVFVFLVLVFILPGTMPGNTKCLINVCWLDLAKQTD